MKLALRASYVAAVQVCVCKCDRLWVQFPPEEMKYTIFSFLDSEKTRRRSRHSTNQQTMPSEFDRKSEA